MGASRFHTAWTRSGPDAQETKMKGKLSLAVVVSAIVGFVQWCWVLPICWMYIAVYDSTSHWLVAHGIEGRSLLSILFVHDTLINILLCLPAAYVLHRLRPRHLPVYLAIAVLTGLLWDYRMFVIHPAMFKASYSGMFLYGMLLGLVMLPGATAFLKLCGRTGKAAP